LTANCVPLLIQQNVYGSNFFNRSWAEFKVGFNDTLGNYWLGNDLLSQLTLSRRYKLRFDLQARDNFTWFYAEYSSFVVREESHNYELHVSGYSGNAGDALHYQNGAMFTTSDRDNDEWTRDNDPWSSSTSGSTNKYNCALRNGGGFWYKKCSNSDVNTVRDRGNNFRWRSTLLLQSTRMWLMC